MNKICTSIEQSKKLIELGIDVNTADMLWTYDFVVNDINGLNIISDNFKPEENDIPAWSFTALLELMPFQIIENNQRYGFYLAQGYNSQGKTYHFEYKTNTGNYMIETYYYNNPVYAAFEMICWLKENEKI